MRKKKNKIEKQKTIHKKEKKLYSTYMYKVCVYHTSLQNHTVCDQHKTLNRSNILRKDGEIHKSYTSNNYMYIHQIFTNLNLLCVEHMNLILMPSQRLKLYHKS